MKYIKLQAINCYGINSTESLPLPKTNKILNFNSLDDIGALLQDIRQLLENSKSRLFQHQVNILFK